MLLSAGFQKTFGPISTISRLGENFGESILVLAPSQVEENWDLRRPLVVFIILCAVNPPLIPKTPPLSRRVNLESRLAGWGPAAGRRGASWGSADWLEEAGRGKLPGMFLLLRSIGPHPAAWGPLAPPAGDSAACTVRRAGWVGGRLWVGGEEGLSPGLSR